MTRQRLALLLTAWVVLSFACLDPAHASGETRVERIKADVRQGELSFEDGAIYRALAIIAPEFLPDRYKSAAQPRCLATAAVDLAADLERVDLEVADYVRFIMASPERRQGLSVPQVGNHAVTIPLARLSDIGFSLKLIRTDATYETPQGHFRVRYATHGSNSSSEAYAITVGDALEVSWLTEVEFHAYRPPSLGGDGRMDVYVADLSGAYGIAFSGVLNLFGESYIIVDRSMTQDLRKVTAAHELFHTVQFEYLNVLERLGDLWWMESTATFMEDEVFDNVNDYVNYLSTFFNNTQESLPDIDGGYETAIFHKLLKEKYYAGDQRVVRDIIEKTTLLTSARGAIEAVLSERGITMVDAIRDFSLWNLFSGSGHHGYYEESDLYPAFSNYQGNQTIGPGRRTSGTQVVSISDLAAAYYSIRPEASMSGSGAVSVSVRRGSSSIKGWVVALRSGRDPEIQELHFGADNTAKARVGEFGPQSINEAVIVLSNGRNGLLLGSQTASFEASLQNGLDLIFTIDTTGSMWDDIASVKASASDIVNALETSGADFRAAVVEYRDFPVYPYGDRGDVPYRAVLPFSSNAQAIKGAINSLAAGGGADWQESVYSALVRSIFTEGLGSWRDGVEKIVLVIGDAPPHDPEPFTGYTSDTVVTAAFSVDPARVYSIVIGGDPSTTAAFGALSARTDGKLFAAASASEVSAAILAVIGDVTGPGANRPPDVTGARASKSILWPVNHLLSDIAILGVSDPDGDPVAITVTGITQDEPVTGDGSGSTPFDATGIGTSVARVRAERSGKGNGRVYCVWFTATDPRGGSSIGSVLIGVPHDQSINSVVTDDGQVYSSIGR
jgi:hypothetical protein